MFLHHVWMFGFHSTHSGSLYVFLQVSAAARACGCFWTGALSPECTCCSRDWGTCSPWPSGREGSSARPTSGTVEHVQHAARLMILTVINLLTWIYQSYNVSIQAWGCHVWCAGIHSAPQMSDVDAGTGSTGLWSNTFGWDSLFSGGASWGFCPSSLVRIWSHKSQYIDAMNCYDISKSLPVLCWCCQRLTRWSASPRCGKKWVKAIGRLVSRHPGNSDGLTPRKNSESFFTNFPPISDYHLWFCTFLRLNRWEEGVTERFSSLIQGMVTQLDRQHGCFSTSEDCTDQCYPPPNLQSLLKLVLVPHIDNMSVQALVSFQKHQPSLLWIILYSPFFFFLPLLCSMIHCYVVLNLNISQLMYFVLDMANFLQCKDDLLQSFCHAFTIPSSFSQQIRAFWMLDHGHIKVYNLEAKLISCISGSFWSLFKWAYAGWLWLRVRIKGQLTIPLITLASSFQQP